MLSTVHAIWSGFIVLNIKLDWTENLIIFSYIYTFIDLEIIKCASTILDLVFWLF